MQVTSIATAAPANRFFSLKAVFLQIKKWLLPTVLWLSFAVFAAPASAQVNIAAQVTTNPFSNYQVFFNVTFTTAQSGLSASNFTLTGTVTGASIQSVAGSGTSWGVTVEISNSFQSSGTLILNMVNNTGVSPGVSGLPVASPSVTDVLYPLTGSATLTSTNANPGYAKPGDFIGMLVTSDHYGVSVVSGSIGSTVASGSGSGQNGGIGFTLDSSLPQGPIAYSWEFVTVYATAGDGSGTSNIIFDSQPPTVSIGAPSAAVVSGDGTKSIAYTVTYADANFGSSSLTLSGITLNTTGTATGTLGISGSGTTYTVTISNISGNGTLGISVGAGYAVDLSGNTEATGAGPSATTSVVPDVAPSISYAGPQGYAVNTAINPLAPTITPGTKVFAGVNGARGIALDYNGNAYTISTAYSILQYSSGGGSPVTAYNASGVTTNVAVAPVSSTTSTLIFGITSSGTSLQSMDVVNGVFQTPVTIGPIFNGFSPVAAAHPASGPDVVAVFTDNNSHINFTARTGGVYSSPAPIANALVTVSASAFAGGSAIGLNTYQGNVKLAFVGQDNNLYYSIYSGGTWSAVAAWATPNISLSGIGAFALDAQGNVWYSSGTTLYVVAPGATGSVAVVTLPAAATGIAFDISGNTYVNCGTEIEELQIPTGFQVTPALPAGLSINSTTGIISGTPATLGAANSYTVTATAATSNLSAGVSIQIITTPSLSYGSPVNATVGAAIATITPTSGSIMTQHYNPTPTTFASISSPTSVAADPSGNLYVGNGVSAQKYTSGGTLVGNFGLAVPGPIASDRAGNLYYGTGAISPYSIGVYSSDGTSAYQLGQLAPIGLSFSGAVGIATDALGDIYASASSSNDVYQWANNSSNDYYSGTPSQLVPTVIGTGFTSVSGVAADAAGNVYVSDAGAGTITMIPANRSAQLTLASGLGAPANICIDGGGNLYYSDAVSNNISEIPAGATTPVLIASGLGTIRALAIDGQGNLFAADNTNNVIDKFAPLGGYFINPVLPAGLTFNSSNGAISGTPQAVSPAANYTVTAYNSLGNAAATQNIAVAAALPVVSYTSAPAFTTGRAINPVTPVATGVSAPAYNTNPTFIPFNFGYPTAVAVDTSLKVYIADPWNFNLKSLAYDPNPSHDVFYQPVFTKHDVAPYFYTNYTTQLSGVAVDSAANLYISKYNPPGFSELVLSGSPAYTETVWPSGFFKLAAVDPKGNVFGAKGTNVVQVTSTSTTTVASGFSNAVGIAVDGPGNLYVSDQGNNTLYQIPAGSSTPTAVATGFNNAYQLAADGTGNIFIADAGNGAVKELPAGGGPVITVIPGLKTPDGVAVDVNGALYVADAGLAQVRRYYPSGGYYISPSLPAGLSFNNSTGVISGTPTAVTASKKYKITAYNPYGSTQTTITFGVAAPSSILAGLTASAGNLSPAFASATLGYSVSAPYLSTQTTVTPTPMDLGATITVNGTAVSPGSPSGAIALSVGANTITIVVTASDHSSTQTYTITVTRAAASSNAQLSGAGLNYIYTGGGVAVTVTPTTSDPGATVTVNGTAVNSGSASSPIALNPGSNTIYITVTAQDGATKLTYKVTVEGPLSGISTLSSLTISAGTLSPAFSGSTTSYSDNVTNNISSVTVTPTTTDLNATVTVNGTAVTSGTASGNIALAVGNTVIPTIVTAQDGVTTTTYTITVTRAVAPNTNLSALKLSSGALTPAFASGTIAYTASVGNAVTSVAITPTTADPSATVKVNGTTVASGTASGAISLNAGPNIITTVVTGSDGIATKTYTLTITRAASTNAYLSNLKVTTATLSPAFAFKTLAYTATVPNATSSVTVTPTLVDATATIKVNGTTVTSKAASPAIALAPGVNNINVVVTAQDGVTTQTYTITITRTPLTIDNLANLSLSTGALSPAFATGTTSYTASVAGVTSIQVTPTAADPSETITVNGTTVASGTASGAIALNKGANTISIVATAQDGVTKKTYTLIVGRGSNDAYLSNLKVTTATLSPAFAFKTLAYTANVPNSTTSVTVTANLLDVTASSLTVNGTSVANKAASGPVTLAAGPNTINVVIIAEDGITTQTYTITITRAPSTDASLAGLSLSNGTLSPAFATGTMSYTTSVTASVTSIKVTPTTTDPTATISVNGTAVTSGTASGNIALNTGVNTINVVVTAQDGATIRTYAVTVTRLPSTDASLAGLTLSTGTLSPAFATGTMSYTASEAATLASIKVTPTTTDATATITVNGAAVTSGTASGNITLNTGTNAVNIVVTAQDGITRQTYTIIVGKGSNDAWLSNMKVTTATLSPAFAFKTLTYTSSVPNTTSSVTVTPNLLDATASSLTVNGTAVANKTASGAIALAVGVNNINVTIIAQDGVTTVTYTIAITRASGGANSYDPGISVTKPDETPTLAEDGILVHQGISPNGDGINDFLQIDNINQYHDNKLSIMNRNGQLVYEAQGYDNSSKTFDGHSNKNGKMQLPGTYFYQLYYTVNGVTKRKTGFIVLKY